MGHGVYVAFLPYNSTGYANSAYWTSGYTQHRWSFNSSEFGGLVLEVGTQRDYGDYATFKSTINSASTLQSPAADQLAYTSPLGRELKMEFQPVTSMVLNPGQVDRNGNPLPVRNWSPAGTIPRTWRDGIEVDFESWNSYQTVQGEEIVHQEWGSGRLRFSAGGEAIEIEVDPLTADVSYYSTPVESELPDASWEEWQFMHFSESEISTGLADMTSDAETPPDGLTNLVEYALNLDPRVADAHLAAVKTSWSDDGGTPVFTIRVRRNPDATDINASIETMRHHLSTTWQTETPQWEGDFGRTDGDGTPLYEYRFEINDQSFLCRIVFEL
jgi:hypothetical protein